MSEFMDLTDVQLIAKYLQNMDAGDRCNSGLLPASWGTSLWEEEMGLIQEFKKRGLEIPKRNRRQSHPETVTKALRFKILKRDKFTCQYCGRKAPEVVLHVDHKIPKSKGGTKSESNLVAACFDCNMGKGAK
jgi:hypothetical protein